MPRLSPSQRHISSFSLHFPVNNSYDEVLMLLLADSTLDLQEIKKILSSLNSEITSYFKNGDDDEVEPLYSFASLPNFLSDVLKSLHAQYSELSETIHQIPININILGCYRINDSILAFGVQPGYLLFDNTYHPIGTQLATSAYCIEHDLDYKIYQCWLKGVYPDDNFALVSYDKTTIIRNSKFINCIT